MADRLADADYRHRFINLGGEVPDVGTVGGRPAVTSGDVEQSIFETVFDNNDFADVPASSDFFDAGGNADFTMFFKVRIIDNTVDAELWGGDSSTSAPVLRYDDTNERLVFDVNSVGGRQARWDFGDQPNPGTVFVGAISYDRTGNILIASNLQSDVGDDISPAIDTTNAALNGADGIRYGGNASGNSNCAFRDAFYIIGEAISQTDLDDTIAVYLIDVEYDSAVGPITQIYSGSSASVAPDGNTKLYSSNLAQLYPQTEESIYSASISEGPIVLAVTDGFNRKFTSVKLTYTSTSLLFVNRKYNNQPILIFGEVNEKPILDNPIDDQVTLEDELYDFTFPEDTFSDPEDNEILYDATLGDDSPLPSWLSFNPLIRRFLGTPTNDDVGTIEIKVLAFNDIPSPEVAEDTFFLVIQNVNDAPTVANPLQDQNAIADTDFKFTFPEDTFDDQDATDTLTYTARLSNGDNLPGWLTFDADTRTFDGVPSEDDIGSIDVEVIATDGEG